MITNCLKIMMIENFEKFESHITKKTL